MPAQPEPSRSKPPYDPIAGIDHTRRLDALFVNAPLRDYTDRSRVNDFTLPVLGMAYLATYAAAQGFNVGLLDAEAHGLGLGLGIDLINSLTPRWVGFNLLAPTYELSAGIAAALDPSIKAAEGVTGRQAGDRRAPARHGLPAPCPAAPHRRTGTPPATEPPAVVSR